MARKIENEAAKHERKPSCHLYLLTPPQLNDDFSSTLARALDKDEGHVAALQLRLKKPNGEPEDEAIIKKWGARLKPFLKNRNITFIINDRPDIALAIQADGVHLGQDDMSVRQARALLGNDYIIGVSAHNSRHLAMTAGQHGADYVAFGAFYPTATKQPRAYADPEILTLWRQTSIMPAVAIGGIKPDNAAPLIQAGADFLAVASGVWDNPRGPAHAISLFNLHLTHHLTHHAP